MSPTYLQFLIVPCYYIINLGCFICIIMLFYIIFWTNLLTQCWLLFSLVFVFYKKINTRWSQNGTKLFDDFSWTRRHLGSFRRRLEQPWMGHKLTRRALWGTCPLSLWAHRGTSNPNLSSINTKIFPIYNRAHQKYFSAAASFCPREIPSGDLFRYSVGGGFDHGGPLLQPSCPSDDA